MNDHETIDYRGAQTIIGKLSGKKINIPNANVPPMPSLAPPGVIHNGEKAETFGDIDPACGYPDVRSFKRKFGLFIPATNTSMEHELWSIIFNNQGPNGLAGVGLHTPGMSRLLLKFVQQALLVEQATQPWPSVQGRG